MIDLKPNDQARLRRTLRFLDDQAPLGSDLPELVESALSDDRRPHRFSPALVLVGTVVVTLLLFLPIALLVNQPGGTSPEQTTVGSADLSSSAETPPVLASGDNWRIGIWEDGSKICHRFDFDNRLGTASGEACSTPSFFSIPNVLNVTVTTGYDESDALILEGIFGLVIEEAGRLVITFKSGDTIELEPGEAVRQGYRGFGVTDLDATQLGEPTTIEVFDGETSLGVYSHETGLPAN